MTSPAGPLDSPVHIELQAFGRSVHVQLPFEDDPVVLKTVLQDMQRRPMEVVSEPDGTNLNGVVNLSLEQLKAVSAKPERRQRRHRDQRRNHHHRHRRGATPAA